MIKKSQTGHDSNVTNFQTAIGYVSELGVTYKPSKASLMMPELTGQHLTCKKAVVDTAKAKTDLTTAITQREKLYDQMDPLAIRIGKAMESSDMEEGDMEDVYRELAKVKSYETGKGKQTPPKSTTPADGNDKAPRKNAPGKTMDNRLKSFTNALTLLENNPSYVPNETDLASSGLRAFEVNVINANELVGLLELRVNNLIISRNNSMYLGKNNLIKMAEDLKAYMIAAFGKNSVAAKRMNKLVFTGLKEK